MKYLYLICSIPCLFLSNTLYSQSTEPSPKRVFVRVFDSNDQKIGKGYIQEVNDDQLTLVLRKKTKTLEVSEVDKLRLKRSFGNSVGTGALIGFGTGLLSAGIIDLSYSENDDFAEDQCCDGLEYAALPSMGLLSGATAGAIVGLFREPVEIQINGEVDKLRKFNELLNGY